jgi:ketosteroid isomerase-like protein
VGDPRPPPARRCQAWRGDYVVDVHRGWATHEDAVLDIHWVRVYRIEDGRIKEVENFAADQHLADTSSSGASGVPISNPSPTG